MMKKWMRYALVALLAVAMLFSFASCDDDDDDVSLLDAEIVNIVAAGLVDAITTVDDDGNYTYASWELDTTTYTLAIMTTSGYEGYVDSAYEVDNDATDAYTVTIGTGSYVYVYLGYMMSAGAGPVVVYVDAAIDGEDEDLALTAYLDSTLTVLTSADNTTVTETDEETGEEVTTTTDYTPSLTINDEASSLSESEIASLVGNLISAVTSALDLS